MNHNLPVSSPELTGADIAAVNEVLETRYLSLRPRFEAFEKAFAAAVGAQHAVGVNSDTSRLHLAVACVQNWSLWLNLKLLLNTPRVVLTRRGVEYD